MSDFFITLSLLFKQRDHLCRIIIVNTETVVKCGRHKIRAETTVVAIAIYDLRFSLSPPNPLRVCPLHPLSVVPDPICPFLNFL
jgi:hypothetical protein